MTAMSAKLTTVAEWLERKFHAWRAAQRGHRAGVTQFARHIGISRDDLNNYLLRGVRPEAERLEKIGQALGWEIYDLVGQPRPDLQVRAAAEAFRRLPAAQRGVAEAMLRQPGLLDLAGQLLPAPRPARRKDRTALEQEWRAIVAELDEAQVRRLLAVARTMAAQEAAAQEAAAQEAAAQEAAAPEAAKPRRRGTRA